MELDPRAMKSARAGMSIAADTQGPSRKRPILQANEAARLALWGRLLEIDALTRRAVQ